MFTIHFPLPFCFSSLRSSLVIFWQHLSRFIFLSVSHSQTPAVELCGCLKFHTLFNVLLACLFLFMPIHFMRFLIISSSLPPVALCSSSLPSTSTLFLCLTHSWLPPSPQLTFSANETKTEKERELQGDTETWHTVIGRPLSVTRYSSTFCSCTQNRIAPLRVQVCACVCVCIWNFHKLRVSLKWLAWGWWSVVLPSSMCCQPQGDHTNTHAYRNTISRTNMHAYSHSRTQTHVGAGTPPLLGLSVPQACLCLPSC